MRMMMRVSVDLRANCICQSIRAGSGATVRLAKFDAPGILSFSKQSCHSGPFVAASGGARCATAATQLRIERHRPDSLDLTKRNFVLCPVVELGRSRRLMASHLLGVLEPSVVLKVNRDAGCTLSVTSDGGEKARRFGPLPNRSPGIVSVKSPPGHGCSS
jgi:hypothetical protein